ncbi:putative membrane protein [Francisella sp. W12-1067]|nr:putative membrane protein [Francisella sp. W12-1067]
MVTLNDIIYDSIGNFCFLIFALLLYRKNRFAWLAVVLALIIKLFLYGKYSMLLSFAYLSMQLCVTFLAAIVWILEPSYTKLQVNRLFLALLTSAIMIMIWVWLVYAFINPAILSYEFLFGFEYFCYMLFVLGGALLVYRISQGLIIVAAVFISYALYYANSALVASKAPPQYIRDFTIYYWFSAVFLFVAGILLVSVYTRVKRSI